VEATFSIGLMSFGFLTLAPLLALGMKTAGWRGMTGFRANRPDVDRGSQAGNARVRARFIWMSKAPPAVPPKRPTRCKATSQSLATSPQPLPFGSTPIGAPDHARIYAVVFQPRPVDSVRAA